MKTAKSQLGRAGFTLIEILVSLILLAVLAAAVFPVVTQQIGAADAPTLANDLSAVKTALETYNANAGTFPGDLEDLVHRPSDTEFSLLATSAYKDKEIRGWNGPYLETFITDGADDFNPGTIDNAFGQTVNKLTCVDAYATTADPEAETACAKNVGHYVAVAMTGFTLDSFLTLNDVVDPSEDDAPSDDARRRQGKLRCALSTDPAACESVFFLATPYVKR